MYNYSQEEQKILKFWQDKNIFAKSLELTKDKKPFVFYDGPPFATGTPHYGHLLQSVIKDAIPRYKTMRGYFVARQWGWDCHGLPIENIVEKELGTKSKKDIAVMGVKKFNDLCRQKIFIFINEWERIISRFGRWADMAHAYRTMDFEYMQSEWWAFKTLYDKGLIYEDHRSLHICPRCETTLSQGEVAEGYKTIKDLSVTIKFKLIGETNTYFLAWTTTPWTLPSNVALAVGADIKYAKTKIGSDIFILAENRLGQVLKDKNYQVVETLKGKRLVGLAYEPLFDYYANDKNLKNRENGWKVYAADFVTDQEGTGLAHEAPAFGADDWELLKKVNLPFVQHVTMAGKFKPEVRDFLLQDISLRAKNIPEEVREVDLDIKKYLDQKGLLFLAEKYEHAYPHCWRCDTALLNYATSSWFVAVEKIKAKLQKTARKINWVPSHIKEGRFGQWLKGARDWSISRQRFWANTIPVWRCEICKKEKVFGSAKELEKVSGKLVNDLHKEVVDEINFNCDCGGKMKRVPEVLDTWFDSGSVPFASLHYPFENEKELKKRLPADFIGEAQDQTRAWFYYQHVLTGALFGTQAFKNCIVTGIVLAEDGKKMSKKLKNYPDPSEVMEKYGADAMRFYMLSSQVVQAENLSFSEKGVDEAAKKNISRLYNVLEFYKLYDNNSKADNKSKNILDIWILARLKQLIAVSTEGYENYKVDLAVRPLIDFIEDLSVWYLRRSRYRFKEESNDKKMALNALRYVLGNLSLTMAPAMPFFAEYLFGAVRQKNEPESVHLANWPKVSKVSKSEISLIEKMNEVRHIVSLALAQRQSNATKVRQPLAKLKIKNQKSKLKNENELLDLIKDEVNVKEIVFDGKIKDEVELDLKITQELREEGILREVVRAVQEMRKEAGLKPQDEILLHIAGDETIVNILHKHRVDIFPEIKAKESEGKEFAQDGFLEKELSVDYKKLLIKLKKI